jgi:hypothetical protein
MTKKQRPYKIWCAYDTETSNKLFSDGNWYAWPVLYIFNDLHECDMARYEVDFPVDSSIKLMVPEKAQDEFAEAAAQAVAEAWKTRKEGGVAWGYGYAVVSYSSKTWYFDDLSQRPGQGGKIGMAVNGHACMYGNTNDPQFSHYEAGADHFINLLYTFDADGKPCVKLPAQVNTEGVTVTVLATEDLTDWSHAAEYPVDPATGLCLPDLDPLPARMFFRFSIQFQP